LETNKIYCGSTLEVLKSFPENSIQCCVTSPPYYGLRDYGTASWVGGNPDCDHIANPKATKHFGNPLFNENRPSRDETKTANYYQDVCPKCGAVREDIQIGLEKTPEQYVQNLVEIFGEVYRVLKDDGTFWLNIGDSYNGSGGEHKDGGGQNGLNVKDRGRVGIVSGRNIDNLKPKDLIGIPWMLAFALRSYGWYLRQDIIWNKNNPMPESVKDRCTKCHEYIFLLSKNNKYFYDYKAIKEPNSDPNRTNYQCGNRSFGINPDRNDNDMGTRSKDFKPDGRNARSVWNINTKPYREAHFATFPIELPTRCIKAGSKEGDIILDPFNGAGTTCLAAKNLNRQYIGIDLNQKYCEIAQKRIEKVEILS
jgi:site-specific DNA-methyltransferase (cytosine-N4-specific)